MFVHTNPVLLYTTVVVSAVHLLFDVLAFKNDVSFWVRRPSLGAAPLWACARPRGRFVLAGKRLRTPLSKRAVYTLTQIWLGVHWPV